MTELKDKNGWDVSYLESKQDSDYATNLDKAVDAESDLVWGVGFAMADATLKAAKDNPNTQFAIIDNGNVVSGCQLHRRYVPRSGAFLCCWLHCCSHHKDWQGWLCWRHFFRTYRPV